MKVFHLVIYSGAAVSRVYVLQKERIVIGRDPGCDLALDSMDVSRRHVVLRCSDTAVTIEDMGSTNGTKVNGEKIASVQTLKPRDEITLGRDFRLVFQVVDSVRSGKQSDSENGLRPGYPLPLPQTMALSKQEFEEQLHQQQSANEQHEEEGSISPPTIPQALQQTDKIEDDED
ncbi:MAG: FHA domain-containing protein [Anaerolineaceae bacterium]|jgi:pSer/pThr/pTyr-binding forkhead associated (FHA) protein|nr:FHA domain-containing protein [Anaerolineaceae bacterium]